MSNGSSQPQPSDLEAWLRIYCAAINALINKHPAGAKQAQFAAAQADEGLKHFQERKATLK